MECDWSLQSGCLSITPCHSMCARRRSSLRLSALPFTATSRCWRNVVSISTQLRQGRVSLYSVNPLGTGESVGRASYYQEFLKGVSKPGQVSLGNLGLPVLAVQSGGTAIDITNDVAGALQECLADVVPYYEIGFDAPASAKADEYHEIDIKVAKSGLRARTRQGYYSQPQP